MLYFDPADHKDTAIKITDDDIQEADRYVRAVMARIGVNAIVGPIPYEVSRLAVAVAYRNRALLSAGRGINGGDDIFMIKHKAYDAQVKYWEPMITPELLVGKEQKRTLSPCIPIVRA